MKTETERIGNVTVVYISFDFEVSQKEAFTNWIPKVINYIDLNIDEISSVITFVNPIYLNEVGLIVQKSKKCKWIIYSLDPYSYNQSVRMQKLLFFYRFQKDIKYYKNADKILLTHELYQQYNKKFLFRNVKFKFVDFGIPMLKVLSEQTNKETDQEFIKLRYFGSFYKNIRRPDLLLTAMEKLNHENDHIVLEIYGSSEDEVLPYIGSGKLPPYVELKDRVDRKEVDRIMNGNCFLVNIGNTVTNQLPSKVVNYVGTGNPIINIISSKKDTSVKFLEKYPLSINFSNIGDIELLKKFIKVNNTKRVKKPDIIDIYNQDLVDNLYKKFLIEITK